jgi:hypothetical protein
VRQAQDDEQHRGRPNCTAETGGLKPHPSEGSRRTVDRSSTPAPIGNLVQPRLDSYRPAIARTVPFNPYNSHRFPRSQPDLRRSPRGSHVLCPIPTTTTSGTAKQPVR